MDVLRRLFTSMGFSGVTTFIASGNVIFESPARNAGRLDVSIEKELAKALGYPVATFLRPAPELSALAAHPLVCGAQVPEGCSLHVMFLRAEPAKETARKVASFSNDVDTLRVYERQVFGPSAAGRWIRRFPAQSWKRSSRCRRPCAMRRR
jgi:uncharacterized protein (DUF1697 family)